MLRATLRKIGDGLLIGIGAGIVFVSFAVFYERSFEATPSKRYGPEAKLSIQSHRPQQPESNSVFVGEVVNEGSNSWENVRFMVELFDEDGQFNGRCSSYLQGSIRPGQTRHFQVSCAGCDETPVPTYDSYTVQIVNASYQPPDSEV